MYRIGILSKKDRSLNSVFSELSKSNYFYPEAYMDSFSLVKSLKENSFQALVIITDEFKPSHIKIITQVKKRFANLPIVVVTEKPNVDAKIQLANFKKTILIHLKSEVKDLNGILLKLINNFHVIPRLSNRYRSAQPARFQIEKTRTHSAYMLDLANDGACFRLFNKRVRPGDKIQIEVPLPDLKKTHKLKGLVVWEKMEKLKNEAFASSQKVGIRFL